MEFLDLSIPSKFTLNLYPFARKEKVIPITLNNPLKACFSNRNILLQSKTHPTQIVISISIYKKN